jgi:hypothetical protein
MLARSILLVMFLFSCGAPGVSDAGFDAGTPHLDGGFDVNDVSFLFPLPAGSLNELLPMGETLLPRALYNQIPQIDSQVDAGALFSRLRVVAARVDPCFPKAPPPSTECVKQLRLVVQPVFIDADAGVTTNDAAIHLFYTISDVNFIHIHQELWKLHDAYSGVTWDQALNVHPVMKQQGLNGDYAMRVKTLISTHATTASLKRVAFMLVAANQAAWTFGAFDVENGNLLESMIPRLNQLTRQGFQEFGSELFRNGELQPHALGDDLRTLASESMMRLTDERTLKRAYASALKIENPHLSSPQTIDCASCHIASRAKSNAQFRRMVDESGFAEYFTHHLTLRREDAAANNPFALRAFGYFKNQSAISQRTINESALIAEQLSQSKP